MTSHMKFSKGKNITLNCTTARQYGKETNLTRKKDMSQQNYTKNSPYEQSYIKVIEDLFFYMATRIPI